MAAALGQRRIVVFFGVVLPHLRPALLTGSLLVALHVVSDFGVVSLMNYHTFSYALYLRYIGYDMVQAAWIALMMLAVTASIIAAELWLLRGLWLHRAGMLAGRQTRPLRIGAWH